MIAGSSQEQLDETKATAEEDLEYFGIAMFGNTEELREFTGKFSLFS